MSFKLLASATVAGFASYFVYRNHKKNKAQQSCCPPKSYGSLACNYSSKGVVSSIGDLPVYVVGQGKRAVIFGYDIYGFNGGRTRFVCDQLAEMGFLVILPDFFRGECWSAEREAKEPESKGPWIKSMSHPGAIQNDLDKVFRYLEQLEIFSVGVVGTCFGGYVGFLAATTDKVKAVVGIHSSIRIFNFHGSNEIAAASKVTCPQMLLQAGNDPTNTKPGGEVEAALASNSLALNSVIREFKDMTHGWMIRGDLSNGAVERDTKETMSLTNEFLNKYVQ